MFFVNKNMITKTVTLTTIFMFILGGISPDIVFSQEGYSASGTSVRTDLSTEAPAGASVSVAGLPSPGHVTVNFKEVDISIVLHYLSEVSGIDIIPAPGVAGKVTMRLRDKPWESALDIVTRNYGYVYSVEGDIIRVMPRGQLAEEETVTELIRLHNLTREVELFRKTQNTSEEVSVTETDVSIQQLMGAVNSMLDPKRGGERHVHTGDKFNNRYGDTYQNG